MGAPSTTWKVHNPLHLLLPPFSSSRSLDQHLSSTLHPLLTSLLPLPSPAGPLLAQVVAAATSSSLTDLTGGSRSECFGFFFVILVFYGMLNSLNTSSLKF